MFEWVLYCFRVSRHREETPSLTLFFSSYVFRMLWILCRSLRNETITIFIMLDHVETGIYLYFTGPIIIFWPRLTSWYSISTKWYGAWKWIPMHPAHLLAFSISEESSHHAIQLSEFIQGVADISVKVLVLPILVIENSFVLFPFFHTVDFWILPKGKDFRQD